MTREGRRKLGVSKLQFVKGARFLRILGCYLLGVIVRVRVVFRETVVGD